MAPRGAIPILLAAATAVGCTTREAAQLREPQPLTPEERTTLLRDLLERRHAVDAHALVADIGRQKDERLAALTPDDLMQIREAVVRAVRGEETWRGRLFVAFDDADPPAEFLNRFADDATPPLPASARGEVPPFSLPALRSGSQGVQAYRQQSRQIGLLIRLGPITPTSDSSVSVRFTAIRWGGSKGGNYHVKRTADGWQAQGSLLDWDGCVVYTSRRF